ncbi:hypothetical protein, partial [Photobacterium carnosum]|uniref:hypothetical protein n=1 Tax=Photobacterium carnosum TaxID=2023717 RepID=UPI001E29473F
IDILISKYIAGSNGCPNNIGALAIILLVMRKNTHTGINIKENISDRGLFLRAMYTVIVF